MKVAIVGTGIAGLGAAHHLHGHHDLTLYERDGRIGGHANTLTVDYDGTPVTVDTGFIVFNRRNYPLLVQLFNDLNVPVEDTDMSFGVSLRNGALEWCGDSLRTVFAQKRNAVSPRFWRMLLDIQKFFRQAPADLSSGALKGRSMGDYLAALKVGETFRTCYLEPMGAAIWSMPKADIMGFPAESFIRFFDNHRLLGHERPIWNTVTGGSRVYVDRLIAPFRDRIHVERGVRSITRQADGVEIVDESGQSETFDQVVLACHSDEALALLGDASADETRLLGAIRYAPNRAYLHKDPRLMPKRRAAWAAWSVLESDPRAPVSVSYWMNALQNLDARRPIFVTLNPAQPPRREHCFAELSYDHPQFDQGAIEAQEQLHRIQGVRNTWFAGAWCGYGFHEDGLRAGVTAAQGINALDQEQQKAVS